MWLVQGIKVLLKFPLDKGHFITVSTNYDTNNIKVESNADEKKLKGKFFHDTIEKNQEMDSIRL